MFGERMSAKDLPIFDRAGHALLFCVTCIEQNPIDIKQAVAMKHGYTLCADHLRQLIEHQKIIGA